jgi:hypothetical protein
MWVGIVLMPIWIRTWIGIKIEIPPGPGSAYKRCRSTTLVSVQAPPYQCAKDQFKSDQSNPLTDRSKGTFQHNLLILRSNHLFLADWR